ncbi:Cullins [Phaffia rhodozyma]|uniref:Nuclear pore protein n=1 Tax=Phaffia rhodozyma TaxID=264483 RepID=A0A0F7SFQ0_PHARH|nr:Cullins [Phaffia rhodozyma]
MSSSSTLASLLAQSRALTSHLDNQELPQLYLGLDQVEEQSRRLVSKGKRGERLTDRDDWEEGRAAHVLATAGLNLADLTYRVEKATASAALSRTFEPLIPLGDGDVDGYLRHTREQLILTALSESQAQLQSTCHRTADERLYSSWSFSKQKVLEEVGAGDSSLFASTPAGGVGGGQLNASGVGNAFERSMRGRLGESSAASASSGNLLGASQAGGGGGSSNVLPPGQTLATHHRSLKYDAIVRQLNVARSATSPSSFPLAKVYASSLSSATSVNTSLTTSGGSNQTATLLAQAFSLIGSIVKEGEPGAGERRYAPGYLGAGENGELGRQVRKDIVQGGKRFLEEQFQAHVDKRVASNPVQAGLGGVPSVANTIRGFVRVMHYKEGRWKDNIEIVNSQPLWAQLYYLIRSGHLQEAYRLALENEEGINRTEKYFVGFFKGWLDSPDRRLSQIHQERFITEYNVRIRHASPTDPFKHALYRLIGRVEVKKNIPVARTTEDWLWFQLSFVREDLAEESMAGSENFGLREMARLVGKFGEGHFDPRGDRPVFWFQVLLFTGEFEKAIAFLYSKAQHQVDAVQFAICLAYYGLLRVPSKSQSSDAQLLSTKTQNGHSSTYEPSALNFARLIQRYIKPFAKNDPLGALQYIYLVCLSADAPSPIGQEQVQLAHEMIRELVLESGRYAELLGDIRTDGTKVPGVIERDMKLAHIPDERTYLLGIVQAAAARSSAQQRLSDAIILYNLAEDYDTVIAVLNKALGSSLSQPSSSKSTNPALGGQAGSRSIGFGAGAEDIGGLARGILDHYQSDLTKWGKVEERNRETCKVLLRLKDAFGLYEQNILDKTLETIESIGLLPLTSDITAINRRADEFKDLDESIAHNFSDVLVVTMNCLFKLHQLLKESSYGGEARQSKMAEYRKKARSLMMFAGMLRYRMSQEVYQQLTRLDAFF